MSQTFGKFRLVERLGGGGMAEVWRAEVDLSEGVSKTVALKMIREDLAKVSQFHSLFIDEARITSRISHANVAQVFDFGVVEGRPFLAMELVHGADLSSLLAAAGEQMRDIPLDVAAFVVAEVARGLDHAHRLADESGEAYGVVHRDVSPQNVLVSYAGEVKVTDFGIARARDKATQTETGTVMGKFRYMSPEQVQGEPLDARSDVFSCGILLYELVTGRQLFDGRTSAQVVDQIRYKDLPELAARRPEVDPALDTVLRWTLERDLDKRCPDAATLARDLERYVHVAHPRFTRDRLVDLMERLLPRSKPVPAVAEGTLAYAGTELAPGTGPEGVAPARPMRSLADLEDDSKGASEPGTTAPAKRRSAPRGPAATSAPSRGGEDGAPSEVMACPDVDPPGVDNDGSESSREQTLTLARRPGRSASQPLPRSGSAPGAAAGAKKDAPVAGHDAPTTVLDPGPDATDRTRARERRAADAAGATGSGSQTRTAGRARGEAAPRPAPSRPKGGAPRKRGRGVEATLGGVLALLLLGVVALLLLRDGKPRPDKRAEPGGAAMGAHGAVDGGAAGPALAGDATVPADAAPGRVAALDQAIAALKPEEVLSPRSRGRTRLALLIRLAGRLAHATVDDPGGRHLGQPCGSAKPWAAPASAAAKLADLYAERALLGGAWPALLDKALAETPALLRSPRPTPTTRRQRSALAALQVLAAPKSAAAQEALILARGAERTWCPPLAGQDGRRYLNPHTVVARDAVARLVLLAPRHAQGRLWKRYLESAPGGQPVRLGTLALTVQRSRREVLKKDDTQVFHVTLTVKNEDPDRPARLRPAGFRLHGAAATPRAAGLWKPDLREPVPAGQTVTLELTFAAPLGPAPATLVLSAPRAGAGSAWLQISSAVLP